MRTIIFMALAIIIASACSAAEVEATKDERLAKPVSIQCVDMRLHTVLEQLKEKTDVTIRCGKDERDWQVRDIPVTVCAKDIPLGKLLETIASSTHLLLSKERIGDLTIYRIWQDLKHRKALDDYFAAKDAVDEAMPSWEWDAASLLKDYQPGSNPDNAYLLQGKHLAQLLAALGPGAKDRVMSGGTFKYSPGTVPDTLREKAFIFANDDTGGDNPQLKGLSPEDFTKCGLTVYIHSDHGIPVVWVAVGLSDYTYSAQLHNYALDAHLGIADVPEQPAMPVPPAGETPVGDWRQISSLTPDDIPAMWRKAGLQAPKDNEPVTRGSLLAQLSKLIGYTIVCEDFDTHRGPIVSTSLFAKNITVRDALGELSNTPDFSHGLVWQVNEKEKIIIGTAYDWPLRHKNLVPEALLNYLKWKLNGDGVDLDDFLKVMALDEGQVSEWIACSEELGILNAYGIPPYRDFWMLYDSLTPQQKAQAQTKDGLPMSDLQPAYLAYLIGRHDDTQKEFGEQNPVVAEVVSQFPYDAQSIASLVMRVTKHSGLQLNRLKSYEADTYPLGVFTADAYHMTFEVTQNGNTRTMELEGPAGLPFHSPEREKALGIKPAQSE